MIAGRRTEREVAQSLRLDRAARGVDELYRAALAAEQEFARLDRDFADSPEAPAVLLEWARSHHEDELLAVAPR